MIVKEIQIKGDNIVNINNAVFVGVSGQYFPGNLYFSVMCFNFNWFKM